MELVFSKVAGGGIPVNPLGRSDWREPVLFELPLDFRRFRYFMAFLMRFAVAHEVVVSSESSEELLDESEELFINSARIPG